LYSPLPPLCKGRWLAVRRDGGVVSVKGIHISGQKKAPERSSGAWGYSAEGSKVQVAPKRSTVITPSAKVPVASWPSMVRVRVPSSRVWVRE